MPRVWRLTPPAFARKLDGEGNRRHGARWNSPGRGIIYTSVNLSLCVLEALAHLPPEQRASLPPMTAVTIEVPDREPQRISREDIASNQRQLAKWCRETGDEWLSAGRSLMLSAPSIIVPQELNVMLNLSHPDMTLVSIASIEDFRFDERLVRKSH